MLQVEQAVVRQAARVRVQQRVRQWVVLQQVRLRSLQWQWRRLLLWLLPRVTRLAPDSELQCRLSRVLTGRLYKLFG